MTIQKDLVGTKLTLALEGRLDTITAPELEAELKPLLGQVTELNFDFAKLDYISSAGLRVLLSTQKAMSAKSGKMALQHVSEAVMEVFQITGFQDVLTIE